MLLSYWVASGLTLAIYDVSDDAQEWARDGGGAGARTPTIIEGFDVASGSPLTEAEVTSMAQATVAATQKLLPDQRIDDVEVRLVNGVRQGIVTVGRGTVQRLTFDTATGTLIERSAPVRPTAPSTHATIKSWHSGSVWGATGNTLALIAGATLFLLVITGTTLYLQTWRLRRRIGRLRFFWP